MTLIPLTGKAAKKAQKGFAKREAYSNVKANANASTWLAEKNRENALKNLPSSLR
jgi:hypothetical protein